MIGIGTRYSDFTTASKSAFQNPDVRFININVAEFDAYKHWALPLVGDARAILEELRSRSRAFRWKPSIALRQFAFRRNGNKRWIGFTIKTRSTNQPG